MAKLVPLSSVVLALVVSAGAGEPGVSRFDEIRQQGMGHGISQSWGAAGVGGQSPIREALERSRAGRTLLRALDQSDAAGVNIGLELLVGEMETSVGELTGLLADGSDPMLVEAVKVLKKLPLRLSREPTAVVMVVIDEWASRLAAGDRKGNRSSRLIEKLRRSKIPRGSGSVQDWLLTHYPILYERAERALGHLIGCRKSG